MKKIKLYIAGPMRGHANYNFDKFYVAEAWLNLKGFDVVSPARMDIEEGVAFWSREERAVVLSPAFTIKDALRRDIAAIAECDAIVLLPGWESSKGTAEELRAAELFGLPVYEYAGDGHLKHLRGPHLPEAVLS